jgi:hypothetical protein
MLGDYFHTKYPHSLQKIFQMRNYKITIKDLYQLDSEKAWIKKSAHEKLNLDKVKQQI